MAQFIPHVNPGVEAGDAIRQAIAMQEQRRMAQEALARQAQLDQEKVREFNASNAINERQVGVSEGELKQRISEFNTPAPPTPAKLRMVRQADGTSVMMEERPGIVEAADQPKPTTLGTLYKVRGPKGEPLYKTAEEAQGQQSYEAPRETAAAVTPDADQVDSFARQVLAHRIAPSQLTSMIGGFGPAGAAVKRAVLDRVITLDPQFNFQEAESNYVFGRNPGTQATVRMIDNISETIPVLRGLVDEMKLGNVQVMNAATIAAKSQFGNKAAAQYELARNIISDEFAKILQGGGSGSGTSDAKMQQALKIMSGNMSPAQWEGVLSTADELLSNRRDTLTKGTYLENAAPKKDTTATAPAAAKPKVTVRELP